MAGIMQSVPLSSDVSRRSPVRDSPVREWGLRSRFTAQKREDPSVPPSVSSLAGQGRSVACGPLSEHLAVAWSASRAVHCGCRSVVDRSVQRCGDVMAGFGELMVALLGCHRRQRRAIGIAMLEAARVSLPPCFHQTLPPSGQHPHALSTTTTEKLLSMGCIPKASSTRNPPRSGLPCLMKARACPTCVLSEPCHSGSHGGPGPHFRFPRSSGSIHPLSCPTRRGPSINREASLISGGTNQALVCHRGNNTKR